MAVLIVCDPVDIHVSAVEWALEKYGIGAIRWHPAPPWAAPGFVELDSASLDYCFLGKGGGIRPSEITAVWMRRCPMPGFPDGFSESV